jgi:hypothetical protein
VLQEENDGLSEAVLHERSKEEAQKTFDKVIWYLERTLRDTNTPKLPHVNVSGIYFPLFTWIHVDLSLQTDRAMKLASRISFNSLATLSATKSS